LRWKRSKKYCTFEL